MPALAKLEKKRFVSCKELRGGQGLRPAAIKNILDQTDVELDARANNSSQHANTSFPVTWTIIWAQNGDLQVASDGAENDQISDKLVELRPGSIFGTDAGDEAADENMKNLAFFRRPEWVAEVLMLAFHFDKLNLGDINPDRKLRPVPRLESSYLAAHEELQETQKIRAAAQRLLQYCDRRDAATAAEVEATLKNACRCGGSALTAAGFGTKQKFVRRSGGRAGGRGAKKDSIFVASLDGVTPAQPVRLKG